MEKKYRILKKCYRSHKTAEVGSYYVVQIYKNGWFFKGWKNMTKQLCYGMDCATVDVKFDTFEEAKNHVANLMVDLCEDEVVE